MGVSRLALMLCVCGGGNSNGLTKFLKTCMQAHVLVYFSNLASIFRFGLPKQVNKGKTLDKSETQMGKVQYKPDNYTGSVI